MFESIYQPLEKLEPFLKTEGVIVIDDFNLNAKINEDPFPGARKAMELFLNKNKNYKLEETIRGNPILTKLK